MYLEADLKTEVISGTRNPEFNYERTFSFERVPPKVTQSFRSFKLNASSFNSTFETREPNTQFYRYNVPFESASLYRSF